MHLTFERNLDQIECTYMVLSLFLVGYIRVESASLILCVFQVGKLSTGDSLDMSQQDEATIFANDATIKDMEVFFYFLFFRLHMNG